MYFCFVYFFERPFFLLKILSSCNPSTLQPEDTKHELLMREHQFALPGPLSEQKGQSWNQENSSICYQPVAWSTFSSQLYLEKKNAIFYHPSAEGPWPENSTFK